MKLNNKNDLATWLGFLEKQHSKEIDLGLERIMKTAQKLKLTQIAPFVITVAGTNGKGSSCRLLEQIFLNAGFKVGLFSSPHLIEFNERVRINGINVKDQDFITAFDKIFSQKETSLSYFEMITLAGFEIFKNNNLDIIILEVGMGGRLDATNIIDANAVLITSIDYDHTAFLGDDLEQIGFEKAGVFRQNIPVVLGQSDIKSLQDEAKKKKCNVLIHSQDFSFNIDSEHFYYQSNKQKLTTKLPLIPYPNVANVIALLELLPFNIEQKMLIKTIEQTQMQGRFETIDNQKISQIEPNFKGRVIVDVGHNGHSARYLAKRLLEIKNQNKNMQIHAVFSSLIDKDLDAIVTPLADIIDNWDLAPLNVPRGQSVEQISERFKKALPTAQMQTFSSVAQAVKNSLQFANSDDVILVFGSFHTCEAFYNLLNKPNSLQ